jgi:hypothetical protein
MGRKLTGINIQWPISQCILNSTKTVETRTYPIPEKYLNTDLAMVETPGPKGKFKSRVVAIIRFTRCFQYKNKKHFYSDIRKHKVTPESMWAWKEDKPKWGWECKVVKIFKIPFECNSKGIIYRKNIVLAE